MLVTDASYTIMAADVTSDIEYHPMAGFSLSLSGDDADLLHGYWDKLSAGGTTTMPMQKQVWGDEFGMCTDKFGVLWLVNISQACSSPGAPGPPACSLRRARIPA